MLSGPAADMQVVPECPSMRLCTMSSDGRQLTIPAVTRDKWLGDPVRSSMEIIKHMLFLLLFG